MREAAKPNDTINPRKKKKKRVWKLRQMSSMPSSRQPFSFFFFQKISSFSVLLFLTLFYAHTTTTSSAIATTTNYEASLLFSWLQPSSSSSSFNWNLLDQTPCNWTAISCSPKGFVTEIHIESVPLHLPLLSNLSSFKSLKKLVVSDANLTGL